MDAERMKIIIFAENELKRKGYSGISLVGQGAFSVVFRVWDTGKNCFWACKISYASEMAENEAGMLKRIRHPLFPKYERSWQCRGYFFLMMEYICGSNIYKLCKQRKQFTQKQAVRVALELAQGLLFLHEREWPILFRDIKPENVMIRQDGRIKLVDMGCATLMNEKQCIAGSKGYSAPEQFVKMHYVGAESDVYALGMLLMFMLTGQGNADFEKIVKGGAGKDGRQISNGLWALVKQATKTECQNRIPDMRVFIQKLKIYEKRHSFWYVWEDIRCFPFRAEIVDFYYVQNIRRGIDN